MGAKPRKLSQGAAAAQGRRASAERGGWVGRDARVQAHEAEHELLLVRALRPARRGRRRRLPDQWLAADGARLVRAHPPALGLGQGQALQSALRRDSTAREPQWPQAARGGSCPVRRQARMRHSHRDRCGNAGTLAVGSSPASSSTRPG